MSPLGAVQFQSFQSIFVFDVANICVQIGVELAKLWEPTCESSLDSLQDVDVNLIAWGPHNTCIFCLWNNQCFQDGEESACLPIHYRSESPSSYAVSFGSHTFNVFMEEKIIFY